MDRFKKNGPWNPRKSRYKSQAFGELARPIRRRQVIRQFLIGVGLLMALALALYAGATHKGWTFFETARHIAAFPDCNAARLVGLDRARPGQPGYYERHDADQDGIACEPKPRRR